MLTTVHVNDSVPHPIYGDGIVSYSKADEIDIIETPEAAFRGQAYIFRVCLPRLFVSG